MRIGTIGMGRMGAGMARRLLRAGHAVVVYDVVPASATAVAADGAELSRSPGDPCAGLTPPRIVWLMLPAAAVDRSIEEIQPLLERGDVLIDGGNGFFRDDIRRAERLRALGLGYVDVGVSGGVSGEERGYCQMI